MTIPNHVFVRTAVDKNVGRCYDNHTAVLTVKSFTSATLVSLSRVRLCDSCQPFTTRHSRESDFSRGKTGAVTTTRTVPVAKPRLTVNTGRYSIISLDYAYL
jgi:hypothetical protein